MLYAILSLAGVGLVFGLILAIAGEKLKVEVDERVERIIEILPGANCGACGQPGCAGFAEAIVAGKANPTDCSPGGAECATAIAEIMGVKVEIPDVKIITRALCGRDLRQHEKKFAYSGIEDCQSAVLLGGGGHIACPYGCLGFESCMRVCPFDAITFGPEGLPIVDKIKCTKCMNCVKECPKQLFTLAPAPKRVHVLCSSKDKGAEVKKYCSAVGCIACKLCEKNCPHDAIHVVDNIARIEYDKCQECGACVHKCPKGTIIFEGGHQEQRATIADLNRAKKELKAEFCPFGAIVVAEDADPTINEKKCNGCSFCTTQAPAGLIVMKDFVKPVPVPKPAAAPAAKPA